MSRIFNENAVHPHHLDLFKKDDSLPFLESSFWKKSWMEVAVVEELLFHFIMFSKLVV